MQNMVVAFMRGIADDLARRAYVNRMRRLDDHLLEDIGLRRDQVDSLILHPEMARQRGAGFGPRRPVVRPSLQGCG